MSQDDPVTIDPVTESPAVEPKNLSVSDVTLTTLVRFLIGRSDAIWSIALCKHGWILGCLFVFSAGLAREYDRSDLLAEPIHLALPFNASIVTSFMLYLFVRAFAWSKAVSKPPTYLEFLQVYWMTAPLAWLYAIPVEYWFNAADAVSANFWLLGIVAIWRVALMIKVLETLFGTPLKVGTALVFAFGDFVLILALTFSPIPVLDIMSGNRLSPAERVVQEVSLYATGLAWISIPVWLIGLKLATDSAKWAPVVRPAQSPPRLRLDVISTAIAVLVIGAGLCGIEQPKWRNATAIHRSVAQDDFESAIKRLSLLTQDNFPRHWELPPNPNYRFSAAEPRRIIRFYLASLQSTEAPAWVREGLQDKVIRGFTSHFQGDEMFHAVDDEELKSIVIDLETAQQNGRRFPMSFHGVPYVDEKQDPARAALADRLRKMYQYREE